MKRKIFAFMTVAVALQVSASAQNLDPTVHVNRAYEGRLMEVHKPSLEMAVPDTLTRFDLDFDYSVFDSPYKGSYEFKPYVLDMQPSSGAEKPARLWLKAGAGYPLHPLFNLVWSPFIRDRFKMNVYADHRSYIGEYWHFSPDAAEGGVIDGWSVASGDKKFYPGYDALTKAGVDGRYDWLKGGLGFDVAYYGLAMEDAFTDSRAYNALDVKVDVASKPDTSSVFSYDVAASYRFAEDKLKHISQGESYLSEHVFDVNAVLGSRISDAHSVRFDVGLQMAAYSHVLDEVLGELSFVPHYQYDKGRWSADLGVRVAKVLRSMQEDGMSHVRDQIVYPDVTVGFAVIPEAMRTYLKVGGGNRLNTYSSLVGRNHHVTPAFGRGFWPLMDCTVERVSASLGLEGRISSGFTYDLRGGYVNYAGALLDFVRESNVPGQTGTSFLPGYGYAAYQKAYAALDWLLQTEPVRFEGSVAYNHSWGLDQSVGGGLFLPATLTGDLAVRYDWKDRVFAGVDCLFSTGRKGTVVALPGGGPYEARIRGYADVGIEGMYVINHMFSLWVRVGNVLNMTVQHNPLFAERGVNFTAGLTFSL